MKYYLHDTSAFDDEKVSELFIKFGYEGVGLFYVLLEKLGKQEKPIKTHVLKKQLSIGKRLEKCWSFMEEIGLISSNNGETFNKQLLNFSEKYQIKKEKTRIKVSEWRDKQVDEENVTSYVPPCNPPKVKVSKGIEGIIIPSWKDDFNIYLTECKKSYHQYYNDEQFIVAQSKLNPNVNVKLSITKGFENFWGTEAGWKHKKKSRIKEIDWRQTIINSIEMNKVYYTKQELEFTNGVQKQKMTY